MDLSKKADSLADKMNRITEKFEDNLDNADELILTGDDILEHVEEKTQDIELYKETTLPAEIINLDNMVSDFKYVRETLKENTQNGRRVLNAITIDLLDSDDEKRASLIMSFAELNKAVADNMKLYILSYKEISKTLLNIGEIREKEKNSKKLKNITPDGDKVISTVDLIKELSQDE